MQSTAPRRSPRIAALKAAAADAQPVRRSARIAAYTKAKATANATKNVADALESYSKIKAACDAALAATAAAKSAYTATHAAAARAAADAVLQEEENERILAQEALDNARESFMVARHYALLSAMRGQPEEEQKQLKFLATVAADHYYTCIKYAIELGLDTMQMDW